MIFPKTIPYVTFYSPVDSAYHELAVSSCDMDFEVETYYSREAIDASRDAMFKGVRFDIGMNFDQTLDHDVFRGLIDSMSFPLPNDYLRCYLMKLADVDDLSDYFEVVPSSVSASLSSRNQVRRHGYDIRMAGKIPYIGIGLFYVVDNDGLYIFKNDATRIVAEIEL